MMLRCFFIRYSFHRLLKSESTGKSFLHGDLNSNLLLMFTKHEVFFSINNQAMHFIHNFIIKEL